MFSDGLLVFPALFDVGVLTARTYCLFSGQRVALILNCSDILPFLGAESCIESQIDLAQCWLRLCEMSYLLLSNQKQETWQSSCNSITGTVEVCQEPVTHSAITCT